MFVHEFERTFPERSVSLDSVFTVCAVTSTLVLNSEQHTSILLLLCHMLM